MPATIIQAVCCTWTGCDFSDCNFGCASKGDCCCLTGEFCVAAGEESLGCGLVTNKDNDECCKIGIPCYTFGLKSPSGCCNGASYVCCLKNASSFPFQKGYVESCTCAYLFVNCMPECGICLEANEAKALDVPMKEYGYLMER